LIAAKVFDNTMNMFEPTRVLVACALRRPLYHVLRRIYTLARVL